MALELRYFVLKPGGASPYAEASRAAMQTYAHSIEGVNAELARELRAWSMREDARAAERPAPLALNEDRSPEQLAADGDSEVS